jgi:hypothetical protein
MSNTNYKKLIFDLKETKKNISKLKRVGLKRELSSKKDNIIKEHLENLYLNVSRIINEQCFKIKPAKEKFFTTIGIEYTFLKKINSKKNEHEISKALTDNSDKRQPWNKRVHKDGEDVVEFPSPVHKNWNDLLNTYRKIVSKAKKEGLLLRRSDCGSGGGHIHMGLPKQWSTEFRLRFLKNFYMDISFRPYLNWIFNEPIDDENANSFLTQEKSFSIIFDMHDNAYSNPCINLNVLSGIGSKNFAVRYVSKYDTIELRFFDMMRDEKTLEDYVEFANAYFVYIYNLTEDFYYDGYSLSDLSDNKMENLKNSLNKFRNKKYTIKEFENFLNELNLNIKNYKKYIKINYEKRLWFRKIGYVKMDYDMIKDNWPKDTNVLNTTELGFQEPGSGYNFSGHFTNSNAASSFITPTTNTRHTRLVSSVMPIDFSQSCSAISEENSQINSVEEREIALEINNLEQFSDNLDVVQKLKKISDIIAQELILNIHSTPSNGTKIKITATW